MLCCQSGACPHTSMEAGGGDDLLAPRACCLSVWLVGLAGWLAWQAGEVGWRRRRWWWWWCRASAWPPLVLLLLVLLLLVLLLPLLAPCSCRPTPTPPGLLPNNGTHACPLPTPRPQPLQEIRTMKKQAAAASDRQSLEDAVDMSERQPMFLKDKGDAMYKQGNYRWGHVTCNIKLPTYLNK